MRESYDLSVESKRVLSMGFEERNFLLIHFAMILRSSGAFRPTKTLFTAGQQIFLLQDSLYMVSV
jgi:hypothetical protein